MKKYTKVTLIVSPIILIFSIAVYILTNRMEEYGFGIPARRLPKVVAENNFPKIQQDTPERIFAFCGKDLQTKDFSKVSTDFLMEYAFDKATKWPPSDKLPKDFNTDSIFEEGKSPGLNIDKLHQEGITGKGVSVAIIDKPILKNHKEYNTNLTYIEVGDCSKLHFHGTACASILAGKNCGVAPDVNLYYFAVPDNGDNLNNYKKALDELIKFNKTLPPSKKIKIVSISDGFKDSSLTEKAAKENY
ncbi:MAG: S8 family serine peptidase [Bacillota bacterium]|nr:S8 family serine peptidase [Bacillota bacterium]